MNFYLETSSGDTVLIEIDAISGALRIKFAGDNGYEITLTEDSAFDLADSILMIMSED